jgi:hypothetical protein
VSVTLLAAFGAGSWLHAEAATSSQTVGDPAGDATTKVAENGQASGTVPNEPKADVVAASATYQAGAIVLAVKMAQPVNVATDPSWGQSVVTWFLDTNGDKKFDYSIEWGADGGKLYADIYNTGDSPICAGQGTPSIGSDGSYIVSLNPKCFNNPAAFNWGGRSEFALGADSIMDRYPDGDGNYFGPINPPGATPPTTRPGGGGSVPPPTSPPTTAPQPIVAAPVAANEGFWLLGRDGGVFSFGTAQYYGSIGALGGIRQVVSMAADPDGSGYWFVGTDGSIYAYKAPFWGSTGNIKLTKPIVGMAATPSGKGYWLVASDGGIFAFGDARFFGSTGNIALNQPIVGMAATQSGRGYWFVASDGGIFGFGDAAFFGSAVNGNPSPVVGMAASKTGTGYRVARADGSVTAFGTAGQGGGMTGSLSAPIVGIVNAS